MLREVALLVERDDVIQRTHALVTVARIEVNKNAQNAKVFMRVFPEDQTAPVLMRLQKLAPDFRHMLGKRIRLQNIPRIYFFPDAGVEEEEQM